MPVASLRSNQVASNDNMDSAKALIGMIDKKVRNLEKRKGKLDSYKQLAADGKELNEDQQASIANLTSVELNLEFAKDLQKQFNQFALEQAKLQKKQAKKEEALRQANRRDAELAMIKNVLELQSVLNQLSDEAREDFINGTNGAVALGEAVVKQIDELYKVITPDEESEVSVEDQITAASQHLAEFFAASAKDFNGTTYKNLSEAIAKISASGYFDQEEEDEESDEAAEEQEEVQEEAQEEAQDVPEGVQDTPVDPVVEEVSQPTVEDVQHNEPEVSNGDTTTSAEATPPTPVLQDDLTSNEHGLNFLGESEVSSRSRIHADAPPFYPSSTTHVTQPPQTSSFDADFAPTEASSGWDEPTYETPEPYRAPEESNRGDRDGFRGGRGGRGGFRGGRGGGGRGGNRGNYSGGNYNASGNYGGGFSRGGGGGGGQNQRGGGGFRSGNRGNRGNFRGSRGQRGGRGGYQQRDS